MDIDKKIYDLIIIGAGPAGTTLANSLGDKGFEILLVDRKKFPRLKVCGGGITRKTFEIVPFWKNLINSFADGCYYHFKDKYEFYVKEKDPMVYFCSRIDFDNDLLNLALFKNIEKKIRKKNVTFLEKTIFKDLIHKDEHIIVQCKNMETEEKVEIVDKYIKGVSANNMDVIRKIFDEHATVEDPFGSNAHVGIEAICKFYQVGFDAGAKLESSGPVRCAGNAAAFPFVVHVPGMKIDVIDIFEFNENGKVKSMRAYWGPDNCIQP